MAHVESEVMATKDQPVPSTVGKSSTVHERVIFPLRIILRIRVLHQRGAKQSIVREM